MRPSHVAWVVTNPSNEGGPENRATWREVGALWPAKNGNGWVLVVHPGISISGRIVITERRDKPAESV
jgi:hypothetical protein